MVFYYEAIDRSGAQTRGLIEAPSHDAALCLIREKKLFPTVCREATDEDIASGRADRNGGDGELPPSRAGGEPCHDCALGSGAASCELIEGPGRVRGELDLVGHEGGLSVVFCAHRGQSGGGDEYLRIAFSDISKVALRGIIWKTLAIEAKSGARYEFSGKVARFGEILRHEMRFRGIGP